MSLEFPGKDADSQMLALRFLQENTSDWLLKHVLSFGLCHPY